ncbi:Putative serine/threonine-protein kinase, active [Septoria linicola]|uniref:Serine/threonine-protein kinase, active n=1 Tax=Septoria linicola TaxID=215465 RepID=A0A9Q9ANT5_9PEZI|nr:putative serine/threonine-protein kinase, active [Septoria linicola]USW52370.1 Putative serine/threonine-protein kinase, active [Septoria linicola]
MSPMHEDYDPLSRNSSMRSLRSRRIPSSRRSSRRSTSANTSVSPAHAFLANWGRGDAEDNPPEPKPDDEGQAIGLNNEYIIGRTISRGGFGIVKEVHSLDDHGNRTVKAVKIVHKAINGTDEAENEKAQQEIEHEVSIWRYLNHRHVLPLHAVYETDYATFCVMDLNVGGTLFDLVRKSRLSAAHNEGRKGLSPHLAKNYAYQLACALRYLHEDIRVCHRDVKLENCLVDMSGPDADTEGGQLRLCDFGLADFLHSESLEDGSRTPQRIPSQRSLSNDMPLPTASSVIGTLEYASPKGLLVNRKLYETAGDVWAFGVIIYALCTGHLPFRHTMPSKTVELIIRADWDEEALRHAAAGGEDVIDLVRGCLEKDIDLRFTISDALRSPWFAGCCEAYDEEAVSPWG